MGRLLFIQQIDEGVGKPELRIRILAFAGDAWITDQRVICPEDEGERIQQKKSFFHVSRLQYRGRLST
jgi:hypothetical protein